MRSAARPRRGHRERDRSGVAANEAGHGLGAGTARRARGDQRRAARVGAGGAAATGSVRATAASSGMHVFSQTSQLAWPRSVTRVPGREVRRAP